VINFFACHSREGGNLKEINGGAATGGESRPEGVSLETHQRESNKMPSSLPKANYQVLTVSFRSFLFSGESVG